MDSPYTAEEVRRVARRPGCECLGWFSEHPRFDVPKIRLISAPHWLKKALKELPRINWQLYRLTLPVEVFELTQYPFRFEMERAHVFESYAGGLLKMGTFPLRAIPYVHGKFCDELENQWQSLLRHVYLFGKPTSAQRQHAANDSDRDDDDHDSAEEEDEDEDSASTPGLGPAAPVTRSAFPAAETQRLHAGRARAAFRADDFQTRLESDTSEYIDLEKDDWIPSCMMPLTFQAEILSNGFAGEPMATGGTCDVHQVELPGRVVAAKVLHNQESKALVCAMHDPAQLFQQEVQALRRLSHPNIAMMLDSGVTSDGRFLIIEEFVSTQTLLECLDGIDSKERINVAVQLAAAIKHVHDQGMIHRDVKSSNVLVDVDAVGNLTTVKLSDFGLARGVQERAMGGTRFSSRICGTTGYMDPDCIRGDVSSPNGEEPRLAELRELAASCVAEFSEDRPEMAMIQRPLKDLADLAGLISVDVNPTVGGNGGSQVFALAGWESQAQSFSTSCEKCPKGMMSDAWGSIMCEPCGQGFYQDSVGHSMCKACPAGRTTKLLGATGLKDCVCQAGSIEEEGQCEPGFVSHWSSPLQTFRCRGSACPGGAPGSCFGGRQGIVCAECPAETQLVKERGSVVDFSLLAIGSVLLVLFILGCAVGYYLAPSRYEPRASATFCCIGSVGIAVALLQNIGVLGTVSIQWPASTTPMFSAGSVVLLDLDSVGINCVAPGSVSNYTMTLVAIVVVLSILPILAVSFHAERTEHIMAVVRKTEKVLSMSANFMQVAFTTLASLGLIPFMCYEHPSSDLSVLKFPNILCGSGEHQSMQVLGALVMVVVCLFCAYCMWGVVKAPAYSGRNELAKLNFLINRFRPEAWWFGLVLLARGTAVSLPAVIAANTPSLLVMLMLSVQHLYFGLLLCFLPWKASWTCEQGSNPQLGGFDCEWTVGDLVGVLPPGARTWARERGFRASLWKPHLMRSTLSRHSLF
eukprot:g24525.t1